MSAKPSWRDRPERVVDHSKCGSWPYCNVPPLPNDRFCAEHRAILDRVKGQPAPKAGGNRPPAAVTVTKVNRITGEEWQWMILAALADQPLTAQKLATACDTNPHNRTFARARRALKDCGKIVSLPRKGREPVYAVAAPAEPSAVPAPGH